MDHPSVDMAGNKIGLRSVITQQCRLRHLRSFCARNVVVPKATANADPELIIGFYYTLHVDEASKEFYRSEVIDDEANLNWKSLNWSQFCDEVNLSLPSVVIKLCIRRNDDFPPTDENAEVLICHTVCFKNLQYFGEQIPKDSHNFPKNTLVFEMFEGFYAMSVFPEKETRRTVPNTRLLELNVPSSMVRNSYDLSTLKRVHTVQRAIKQTRASVLRVRNVINAKLTATEALAKKKAEKELIVAHLNLLRDELDYQKQALQRINKQCQEIKQQNQQKDLELVKYGLMLKQSEDALVDERRNWVDAREAFIKTATQLGYRQRQLLAELAFIYPIEALGDKVYTICGVPLPNSEDFNGRDEVMISVALGYVCYLVTMMAQFLHVPLRYPIVHLGTRSKIYDYFLSTIPDTEREFPLFARGKDKLQFKYGVYLLNKNISQLRFYCGLTTQDLRLTLPNLKSLLERPLNRMEQLISAPVIIEKVNIGPGLKQITKPTEDAGDSTDSMNLEGSRHRTPLWKSTPECCRTSTLSISLDHGLDEIVEDGGRHAVINGKGPTHHLLLASTELHLSEPSLPDLRSTCNGKGEPSGGTVDGEVTIRKALAPLRIYASESESEEAAVVESSLHHSEKLTGDPT